VGHHPLVYLTDVPDGRALSVLDIHRERHAGDFNRIVLTEDFAAVDFLLVQRLVLGLLIWHRDLNIVTAKLPHRICLGDYGFDFRQQLCRGTYWQPLGCEPLQLAWIEVPQRVFALRLPGRGLWSPFGFGERSHPLLEASGFIV
jgi:hypothetical protein